MTQGLLELDMPQFDLNSLPEFDIGGYNPDDFQFVQFDPAELTRKIEPARYMKPRVYKRKTLKAKYAKDLADSINIEKGSTHYVFLGGRFVFGDFLHDLIVKHDAHITKMHIATLSMSYENVTSLRDLILGDFVDSLDLHVSIYFYAHERRAMVPFIYESLDIDNKFQMVVSANHTKLCLLETEGGRKITIHGSANLRSSDNLEQIEITEDAELYDFNRQYLDELAEKYRTINKPVRKML